MRKIKKYYHAPKQRADYWLFIVTLLLTAFGVLMVYDASVAEAFRDFSDPFYYARNQLQWAIVGVIGLLVAARIPLNLIKKLAFPFFLITIFLLIIVLIPGIGQKVQGARRWLNLGGFTLQPSELVKLSFVLYLSSWLEKPQKFLPFIIIAGIILLLVIAQPDLGTAIVVTATGFLMYFLSGASIAVLGGIGIGGFLAGLGLILTSSYRRQRVMTFFDPSKDPLGASYHIRQVLIAIGSGGLWGVGVGRSRQKYQYLPEAPTDSIFAVIGEEVGFFGAGLVVILFLFLLYRGFKIAQAAPTHYLQLLAGGLSSWIGMQTFINLASMVALVPLTGVPLPLISYGGSSLVTILTAIGLLINISRQKA